MTLALAWSVIGIAVIALVYRWRTRALRVALTIIAAALALAVTLLVTGPSAAYFFEALAARLLSLVIVSVLAAALVIRVLPRLNSRSQRHAASMLAAIAAVMYAAIGLSLWRGADDGLQFASLPVARTGDDVLAWRDRPARDRIFGVLVEARLGDLPPGDAATPDDSVVAGIACRSKSPLGSTDSYLPSWFTITLADGSRAVAQGISSVGQAWDWPDTGRRLNECGLRDGDPVVFWGDPGATRALGEDDRRPAVDAVRMIGYGDADQFRSSLQPAAERIGRAGAALAALSGGLMLAALAVGIRTYLRLRRPAPPIEDARPIEDAPGPEDAPH